ncbi:GGDEF domain-containing protein [Paenibacillus eucommiae]|uniref:Diguanylate cyclase (GGDEF)-like protein n=1 Tax=Paenibacillus eucommiae TaxID=1355755 RepID=A0ABS4IQ08_9BACL|nr:GGDEF domain-containing protein [Paenibacillus eucommiae]MBP1989215.1 diguanylate cyclase (GGDEF)-like protein [Paenibacillus eucommiae]
MKPSDYIFGASAPVFSHAIVLVILVMMFIVSLRLYVDRRKKGYLSMTISLCFQISYYVLLIYFHLYDLKSSLATYTTIMLNIVSFTLLNMGIYQLYNPTKLKQYSLFYSLITFGFIVSLLYFYLPAWYQGTEVQMILLQDIGLRLYLFILIFVFFYFIAPYIGQRGKYQFALTVYFADQIARMINLYIFDNNLPFLSLIEHALPILFYFLLFLLLFERVVEVMQAIYNSAITDSLTQLYNRHFFCNKVEQYVRHKVPVSVLFCDIDNFKKLNDTKGHHTGDQMLRLVAKIVKEESEDHGIAGRYGGEEIVVLTTDSALKMRVFAERIRKRVEVETSVTLSLGYSKYKSGITAAQLIKQADEAMYRAKKSGKNKVVSYDQK